MKYLAIFLSISFLFTFVACNKRKDSDCLYDYHPNNSLIFQINKQGIITPDSILNKIKLTYYDNGVKKIVNDFQLVSNSNSTYKNMGLFATRDIGANGTKTYYFEDSNGLITDSLFTDYSPALISTGCTEVLRSIKFNNQIPLIDSVLTKKFLLPVYIFNK